MEHLHAKLERRKEDIQTKHCCRLCWDLESLKGSAGTLKRVTCLKWVREEAITLCSHCYWGESSCCLIICYAFSSQRQRLSCSVLHNYKNFSKRKLLSVINMIMQSWNELLDHTCFFTFFFLCANFDCPVQPNLTLTQICLDKCNDVNKTRS